MVMIWLSASFGYYLISYQLKYIRGDIYLNGIVSSTSELFAYGLSGWLLQKLGIKKTLSFAYAVAMVGMFSLIATTTDNKFWLSLFILGSKFGVSAAFNVAYVGNYALFPVNMVATTMGICNIVSRVATIFAPYIAENGNEVS